MTHHSTSMALHGASVGTLALGGVLPMVHHTLNKPVKRIANGSRACSCSAMHPSACHREAWLHEAPGVFSLLSGVVFSFLLFFPVCLAFVHANMSACIQIAAVGAATLCP